MKFMEWVLGIASKKQQIRDASVKVDVAADRHDMEVNKFLNKGAKRTLSLAETNGCALHRLIQGNKR